MANRTINSIAETPNARHDPSNRAVTEHQKQADLRGSLQAGFEGGRQAIKSQQPALT